MRIFIIKQIIRSKFRGGVSLRTTVVKLSRRKISEVVRLPSQEFLYATPSWLGGAVGVGTRVTNSNPSFDANDSGSGLCYRVANRLPIPRKDIWKAFDNYLEFRTFNENENGLEVNTKHYNGPINKIGEKISFNSDIFGTVIEELTIKDNKRFIWQITRPYDNNKLFKKYYFTVRLYDDYITNPLGITNDNNKEIEMEKEKENKENLKEKKDISSNGCLLVTETEIEFADGINNNEKELILNERIENTHIISKLIYDRALNIVGSHLYGKCIIHVPINWFWSQLNNWNNINWILSSKQDSCILHNNDIRSYDTLDNRKILERISICDPNNFIFERQLLDTPHLMPFRDNIKLTKINNTTTKLDTTFSFYLKPKHNTKNINNGNSDNNNNNYNDQLLNSYRYVINQSMIKLPNHMRNIYIQEEEQQ